MLGIEARYYGSALMLVMLWPVDASAQFLDDFSQDTARKWLWFAGDGDARAWFFIRNDVGRIHVDSTKDKRNVWWALIKRDVSPSLDLSRLKQPNQELRISARVRLSHAPRRVNLHLNTQKTTDFHTHLMEFDIPTAAEWHAISFTTQDFAAKPGDSVRGQLALMDWGRGKYAVEVDDFRVDVVDVTTAGPDLGQQVAYHPPIPPVDSFDEHLDAAEAAMIDLEYPDQNFADWVAEGTPALAVGGPQRMILRWDLSKYAGRTVAGAGLLELTTHSLERLEPPPKDFGLIRVAEVLGGEANWDRRGVTLTNFAGKQPLDEVFNPQMIIDIPVADKRGEKTLATINAPALQRMLDGGTRGLVALPLGAIHATFEAEGKRGPKLHLNLQP